MGAAGLPESGGLQRFVRSTASCVKLLTSHSLACQDIRTHPPGPRKTWPQQSRAEWLVSRHGHSLSPTWPGGEQFSVKCRLATSGMPAQRLPCRFVAQHIILLGNLSAEDKEELGEENEPCLQRVIFISRRISATFSPVAANDIPSEGEIP